MTTRSIDYVFTDLASLQRAYMPFVLDGGIFIPTQQNFKLGEEVTVDITLPNDMIVTTVTGEIIWITPKSARSAASQAGIGIQFTGNGADHVRKKIKILLENISEKESETDTM